MIARPRTLYKLTTALTLVGALWACSSGNAGQSGISGKMYDSDDLGEFVKDTAPVAPEEDLYLINAGDVLDVVFLYHSDLTTRGVPVRSDGKISLPHVGDAQAAGLTPMALDSMLTERFAEILREPSLSVIVKEIQKKRIYVLGEVGAPRGIEFDRNITIVQAIAEAGGLTKTAKPSNSVLIRQEGESKIVGIEIDISAILNGSAVFNDIRLKNYDIVYVPRSRIQSVVEFIEAVNKMLSIPVDAYLTVWQIRNLQATYEFFSSNKNKD